jgi:hypothetical protein
MNGWTGLFELKNHNGNKPNKHQQHNASIADHFAKTYGHAFTGGKSQGSS